MALRPYGAESDGPAKNALAVTPADATEFTVETRGIWVGGAGDLAVTMVGGGNVTFVGVPAGTLLPICVTHVRSTGTTATSITRIW